jgi:multidrug efflux pump subunit AcrB
MADFKEQDGSFIIRRLDRRRTFSISGEVDRLKSTSRSVNKSLKNYVNTIVESYDGMTYELSGENKDTADSLESFKKALVGSVFIIFILLVVQFSSLAQPVIIMSAIPFGLIGVVGSFMLFGLPLGFMALMGMLGLVGVVINDSIVLVTFINRYLKEYGFSINSLVKASVSRFRPVILTTITTVVGLLPIAHMPGGDPFLKPRATSFA